MKSIFKKLLLGKISAHSKPKHNPIEKRILNIKAIWNNDHQDDNGIEKLVRLFLATSQLFFPGIYIKYVTYKKGREYQDLTLDFYILAKVLFPLLILIYHAQHVTFIICIMIYLLVETVFYVPTLIFASDLLSRPRSYKRSMLLLFFNYFEIIISFAVLYTLGNNMNRPFLHWFDSVYFSVICSNSIGFGDYYPVTLYGKMLVSIQALFFFSFVVLFLNFFSTKVKTKGYFEEEDIL